MSTKENIKVNENIAVNESKNTTKFNKDNNNFNERTNNTLNQQQDDYSTIALWLNRIIRKILAYVLTIITVYYCIKITTNAMKF